MNKEQLLARFAAKMQPVDFDEYKITSEDKLFIKPLSALERAQFLDNYNELSKQKDAEGSQIEKLVKKVQGFAIVKSLVDEKCSRLFSDEEIDTLIIQFPCDAFDFISNKIMKLNSIDTGDKAIKNSDPIPSVVSS
jgi:hypothetical protein